MQNSDVSDLLTKLLPPSQNIGETRDDQFFSPHFVALKNFSPFVVQSTCVHEPLDGWRKLRMTNHVAISFGGWFRRLVVGVDQRFDSYLFKFSLFPGAGFDLVINCNGYKMKQGAKQNKRGNKLCCSKNISTHKPPIWTLPMFITWNIVC